MADATTDLSDTIAEAATSPASASSDGQSVTARPLSELVDADNALRQRQAVDQPHRGLRFTKLVPPGAA